jgi:hypothetical protein
MKIRIRSSVNQQQCNIDTSHIKIELRIPEIPETPAQWRDHV